LTFRRASCPCPHSAMRPSSTLGSTACAFSRPAASSLCSRVVPRGAMMGRRRLPALTAPLTPQCMETRSLSSSGRAAACVPSLRAASCRPSRGHRRALRPPAATATGRARAQSSIFRRRSRSTRTASDTLLTATTTPSGCSRRVASCPRSRAFRAPWDLLMAPRARRDSTIRRASRGTARQTSPLSLTLGTTPYVQFRSRRVSSQPPPARQLARPAL
jgi:hypothetical protein